VADLTVVRGRIGWPKRFVAEMTLLLTADFDAGSIEFQVCVSGTARENSEVRHY